LRQIAASLAADNARLYAPQTAIRIRNDMNPPTPWPPDMATGQNPPDGAILDYYLGPEISGVVSLTILDAKNQPVAHFNSNDPVPPLDPRYPDPPLWAQPPHVLSAAHGHHRFLWDMHYPQVPGLSTEPDEDQAVPYDTPSVSTAPWVMPGDYTVRLTAGGKTFSQRLKIVMDPRVKTPMPDLEQQFTVARSIYDDLIQSSEALHEITSVREQLKARASQAPLVAADASITAKIDAIAGRVGHGGFGGGRAAAAGPPTLTSARMELARLEHEIESADAAPTTAQVDAYHVTAQPLSGLLDQWQKLKQTDLKALNARLIREHSAPIRFSTRDTGHSVEDQIEIGDED
jgi:hypothetical protein